jgi:hypothetical protein
MARKVKRLFIKGRKDGVARRVDKLSPKALTEEQANTSSHVWVLLENEPRLVARNRIESYEVTDYGPNSIGNLPQHSG